MKIQLENIVLSRGIHFCECPEHFKIQGIKEIQIVSLLRAKEVKIFDRGNSQITITFKISRQHSSANSALTHVMQHIVAIIGVHGNAYFDLEDTAQTCFSLQNATIRQLSFYIDGLTSYHSYEIIGSKINPLYYATR